MKRLLALPLIFLIRVYQYVVSPLLGPSCRFQPTCSAYAIEALRVHGAFRGSILTARRLFRCHPFARHSGAGWTYDPVPEPADKLKR